MNAADHDVYAKIAEVLVGALGVLATITIARYTQVHGWLIEDFHRALAGRRPTDAAALSRAIMMARWRRVLELLESAPAVPEAMATVAAFRRSVLSYEQFVRRVRLAATTTCGALLLAVAMMVLALAGRLTRAPIGLAITLAAAAGSLGTYYPLARDVLRGR